jgi:exodeoxyribonuclease VII small subunit
VTQQSTSLDASLTFEQALTQLTALVQKLESGQLPLEESVLAFEQGVKLSRHCETLLDHADQRLHILNQNGELSTAECVAQDNEEF